MLTPQEVISIRHVADRAWSFFRLPTETQEKLHAYFMQTKQMPYEVARARLLEPGEWMENRLRTMSRHVLEMWLIRESGLLEPKVKQPTFKQYLDKQPA